MYRSFTNFAEWNCDIRVGAGINLILFDPKTLVWRFPTIFMVGRSPLFLPYDRMARLRRLGSHRARVPRRVDTHV